MKDVLVVVDKYGRTVFVNHIVWRKGLGGCEKVLCPFTCRDLTFLEWVPQSRREACSHFTLLSRKAHELNLQLSLVYR